MVALRQVVSLRIYLDHLREVTNVVINYRGDTSNSNFTVFDAKKHVTFSVTYFDAVSIRNIAKVDFNLGYMHALRVFLSYQEILNIRACWITTTTQSTQFNGRSNAFAGAFTVQATYTFRLFDSDQNINASYGHSYNADNIIYWRELFSSSFRD